MAKEKHMKLKKLKQLVEQKKIALNEQSKKDCDRLNAILLTQAMNVEGVEIIPSTSELIYKVEYTDGHFSLSERRPGEFGLYYPASHLDDDYIIEFVLKNQNQIMDSLELNGRTLVTLNYPKKYTNEEVRKLILEENKNIWLKPEPAKHVRNPKNNVRGISQGSQYLFNY